MTFSIVARCARTGQLGVGALTAMAGVGKIVAHVRPHARAAATQATPNPYLAYDGLPLLAEGRPPQQVLDQLLEQDPGRDCARSGWWTGKDAPSRGPDHAPPSGPVTGRGLLTPCRATGWSAPRPSTRWYASS
jgi:hypothetical protein